MIKTKKRYQFSIRFDCKMSSPISFDLLKSLIRHLDPHLSIVLVEYYETSEHKVFPPDLLQKEKLSVLVRTKIIDYIQSECDKVQDPKAQQLKAGNTKNYNF